MAEEISASMNPEHRESYILSRHLIREISCRDRSARLGNDPELLSIIDSIAVGQAAAVFVSGRQ